tara:strand:- start:133 stop:597 length:465 start_codon:yes stop_codon:yes gene_type:complete
MEKLCKTCFYQQRGFLEEPCRGCPSPDGFNNWVAATFLDHVDEGESVISTIVETLQASPTRGVKYDGDKPRWELLPFKAVREVVEVLTYGSNKYADDNWKIVPDARKRYISASFRHLTAWAEGEKNDNETGKSHLAHAICCLLFLLWFEQEDKK